MKNDTTFVKMRSRDHHGDSKCHKKSPRFVEFKFFKTHHKTTPQNVSVLAVGQGSHARIFVDLKVCGDRSACRVLTPPSAPDATVLTSSKLRFWHALEGKIKEEKTCRQGS